MLKFHTSPYSTYARRVEIALLEKGIDAERVHVDMANREHRSEPFLALNAYGRVPALVDGDFVLAESVAILRYLEATHPEPALLPADPQQQALASMHMHLCDIELAGPNYTTIFSKRFLPQDRWRADEMERARKPSARHLGILDRQLEGKEYLVAERFSLADLCYIPFLHFRSLLGVEIPTNVERWAQALLARPSALASAPPL